MKKYKYIPGDLVKIDGKLKVVRKPKFPDFRVRDIKTSLITLCCVKDIEPIPLTPAILEANGWEKLDNAFGFPSYNHTEAEWLNLCLEPDGWRAYCLNVVVKEFEFVHQLQHLLFGLGLDNILKV